MTILPISNCDLYHWLKSARRCILILLNASLAAYRFVCHTHTSQISLELSMCNLFFYIREHFSIGHIRLQHFISYSIAFQIVWIYFKTINTPIRFCFLLFFWVNVASSYRILEYCINIFYKMCFTQSIENSTPCNINVNQRILNCFTGNTGKTSTVW